MERDGSSKTWCQVFSFHFRVYWDVHRHPGEWLCKQMNTWSYSSGTVTKYVTNNIGPPVLWQVNSHGNTARPQEGGHCQGSEGNRRTLPGRWRWPTGGHCQGDEGDRPEDIARAVKATGGHCQGDEGDRPEDIARAMKATGSFAERIRGQHFHLLTEQSDWVHSVLLFINSKVIQEGIGQCLA